MSREANKKKMLENWMQQIMERGYSPVVMLAFTKDSELAILSAMPVEKLAELFELAAQSLRENTPTKKQVYTLTVSPNRTDTTN